jgi:hypothetical protein
LRENYQINASKRVAYKPSERYHERMSQEQGPNPNDSINQRHELMHNNYMGGGAERVSSYGRG